MGPIQVHENGIGCDPRAEISSSAIRKKRDAAYAVSFQFIEKLPGSLRLQQAQSDLICFRPRRVRGRKHLAPRRCGGCGSQAPKPCAQRGEALGKSGRAAFPAVKKGRRRCGVPLFFLEEIRPQPSTGRGGCSRHRRQRPSRRRPGQRQPGASRRGSGPSSGCRCWSPARSTR